MSDAYSQIVNTLTTFRNPSKIEIFKRFFKTGPGQYGEGDQFYGLTNPQVHMVESQFWKQANLSDIQKLLNHPVHEFRCVALLIMTRQFAKASPGLQQQIYNLYLANTTQINNWDLVDLSAPKVVGLYLLDKPRDILYDLAISNLLWDRRISIISTFAFIRQSQYKDTLEISKILLSDKQDLIHKAVGWMLREIGKRDLKTLTDFLDVYATKLPRTALRYAIEKFPETQRQHYLKLKT
ncbi:MAG: DNA alkylation repair protein [Candidatus Shapirobacteria bacterium]